MEHQGGAHSGVELLAAQIDAAVNAGNSGGPVLASGRVVGVAYQGLWRIAEHFLHDSHAGGSILRRRGLLDSTAVLRDVREHGA